MARTRDPVLTELKKIRRKLSKRLMQAHRKGRLHEELLAVEKEGQKAWKEAINGRRNDQSDAKKRSRINKEKR